jgi:hypothetical protein
MQIRIAAETEHWLQHVQCHSLDGKSEAGISESVSNAGWRHAII